MYEPNGDCSAATPTNSAATAGVKVRPMLFVAVALGGFVTWGFFSARRDRNIDQRHFIAFIGFTAALIAVALTIYDLIEAGMRGHLSPYTDSTVLDVFHAALSVSFFGALLVTFLAGLLSRGLQRIGLVCCSVVVSLMLLLTIASHFGD